MSEFQYHDPANDDSDAELEDDLKILEKMNFNSSTSSRGSFAVGKRMSLSVYMRCSTSEHKIKDMETIQDEESDLTDGAHSDQKLSGSTLSVAFSGLTAEEKRDIRAWSARLSKEKIFSRYYFPERWEIREMTTVMKFLEFRDQCVPSYLDQSGYETTKRAVTSLFFPGDHDPKSVLLKRGPILFDGEHEKELMLFTHGFVLARIGFDTLLNGLFSIFTDNLKKSQVSSEQLRERFNAIDLDLNGSLDRCELKNAFTDMSLPISEQALNDIIEKFDTDKNGTIEVDEFVAVVQSRLEPKKKNSWDTLNSWGNQLKRSFGKSEKKLDGAYLLSDIHHIEVINICPSESTKVLLELPWADLVFAIFVEGRKDPLIMVCSKPEQRSAWVDAFQTCYVKSIEVRANTGSESAKKICQRVGWQHRKIRASLFSLVVGNDKAGLRKKVADPSSDIDIDDQDKYHGYTALHYAVVLDRVQSAEILLQHGANANLHDSDQKTPLDHTTVSVNDNMIHLLKRFGGKKHSS